MTAPDRLSTEIERVIGRFATQALESAAGVDEDPLLLGWVQRIAAEIMVFSPREDLPPRYAILGSDVANALALPGSQVFVTRGLLDTITSDDELAGVLAHETAHVAKHHAWQQLSENALAITILSQLHLKSRELKLGGTVFNILRALNKSREHELQADAIGLTYAAAAGYDPRGLLHFMEGIGGGSSSRLEEYFATHPTPERRIAKSKQSPLVTRPDDPTRAAVAAGLAARGLSALSESARRGEDTLALPPLPSRSILCELAEEQKAVVQQSRKTLDRFLGSYKTLRTSGTLQQLLLLNGQGDPRWLYLATRAYGVQTRIQDIYARSVRILQASAGVWDGLLPSVVAEPGELALGRAEVRACLEASQGVPVPLSRAASAAAVVLTDLNADRLWRLRSELEWTRYGSLEGLLRYAESELSRADRASAVAWRSLSLARIRRYQTRLSQLVSEDDAALRALWRSLASRRFGRTMIGEGPTGIASVRAALAVQRDVSEALVDTDRAERFWADRVLAQNGVPENIATALRLLTLDLERELAARQRR